MTYHLDDYQEVAVEHLLANSKYGLFDEQGVGKTPPTLVALRHKLEASPGGPALITVPAYLIPNWMQEIHRWIPGATIATADGEGKAARTKAFEANVDIVLTSYHNWAAFEGKKAEGAPHKYPILHRRKWGQLIFDEAHRLRGRNSQWTRAVFQLQNAESKNRETGMWFLTGTPLVRDAGDLWPFYHLMDRHLYRSYWSFVEARCQISFTPWDKVVGPVTDEERFRSEMDRYSLRRLVADIPQLSSLEVLPPEDIWVRLSKTTYEAMKKLKRDYILEHPDLDTPEAFESGGHVAIRLRQLASVPPTVDNPKLNALKDLLEELEGQRVIIFCWFRETAKRAAAAVRSKKRPVMLATGDQTTQQKVAAIDLYNQEPNGTIVATIAAMKEGANLQAGHTVIFLEEADLPADLDQALARVKRRGQKHPVRVIRILAESSADVVVARAWKKRDVNIRKALLEYAHSADL